MLPNQDSPGPARRRLSTARARLVALVVLACAGAVACAPGALARAPRPEPEGPVGVTASRAERWVVHTAGTPRTHELRLEGTLVSRIDSTERTDTLQSVLRTTWTFAAAPAGAQHVPERIAGSITEFRVSFGGSAALEAPPRLSMPVRYAAESGGASEQPLLTIPRPDECGVGASASALSALRELWVSPPETLFVGRTWRDSTSYVTCRDSIPLTVTSTRAFRVLGAESRDGETFVRIARRSTTHLLGNGTQFGEPLQLEAEGVGEMLLELALDGGAIRSGAGESELRVEMRGRRRVQELVQRTRLTITTP